MRTSFSLTRLLIWSLIGVFFLQLFLGGDLPSTLRYGLTAQGLDSGRWWTLLTYGWVHSANGFLPWHLVWNLLWLNFLGRPAEAGLGWKRFLGLYLASLLGAAVVWRLCSPGTGVLIGASGAVFGLLAAYPKMEGNAVLLRLLVNSFFRVAVGFEIACVLFGWLPGTAHWAHLGGAFGGWWFIRVFGNPMRARAQSQTAPPPEAAPFTRADRPSAEKEIPVEENFFSNYNSTPQPPEGR